MRVLLINPFYPISETPSPPLGLAYLAAALQAAGAEVRVLDLVVYPYSEAVLALALEEFKPVLVGLTAVSRKIGPDIVTIHRYYRNIRPIFTPDEDLLVYFVDTTGVYEPCLIDIVGGAPVKETRRALSLFEAAGVRVKI